MRILIGSFFCAFVIICQASPFINLGFDEARTNEANLAYSDNGFAYGDGPTEALLPGWSLKFAGKPMTNIVFNTGAGSLYTPMLYDQHYIDSYGGLPPEGNFALFLTWPVGIAYELSQVGEIPTGARFLSYRCLQGPFEVWIDEERLPPLPPGNYQGIGGIAVLVFDVARFAGKTVKLGFKPAAGSDGALDSIQFFTELPTVRFHKTGNNLVFTWPDEPLDVELFESDSLRASATWKMVPRFRQTENEKSVTIRMDQAARYYRLELGYGPWTPLGGGSIP